ncbi:MAG: N-acetylmuramoyl-L-alanine amidase [Gemmatimonadetes bacterium]|nr:N-acetylmuramoyl-L-alanine amidase [Gemmatimonadota bacterium]
MTRLPLAAALVWGWATPLVVTVASSRGERRVPVRVERGFPAVAAADLAPVLSLEAATPRAGAASVRVVGRSFDFVLDAPYFRFQGRLYPLVAGPYVARDTLFVPLQWVVESLPRLLESRYRFDTTRFRLEELPEALARPPSRPLPLAGPPPGPGPARRRIVALDPGHGGPDVGMVGPIGTGPFLREKQVTLAVARAVAEELARRGIGAVLTRTKDTLIALRDRGRVARARGADLFLSIHVNAANPRWRDAEGARGVETYFLAEARTEDALRVAQMENESVRFETTAGAPSGDPLAFILNDLAQNEHLRESSRMAELVQGTVARVHPGESRGVKQAGFMVLATSFMPAVLIEIGFGSNYPEARFLTGATGQRRIARAIADGVERYLEEYERRLASSEATPG